MICLTIPLYCPSAVGRIEFLSFGPVTGLQKLNSELPTMRELVPTRAFSPEPLLN